MQKIDSFREEYFFLSNFYEAAVTFDGITYGSNEAAFQAQKCLDPKDRAAFAGLDASASKKKGRRVNLRPDWEKVKVELMRQIVRAKFNQHPELAAQLLATGDAYLEEGNDWGDRTWGTVGGKGRNLLGQILMEIREELKQ